MICAIMYDESEVAESPTMWQALYGTALSSHSWVINLPIRTPNLPANIIPTNIAWLKPPGNSLWAWESHPLELVLCLSQTLWNPYC